MSQRDLSLVLLCILGVVLTGFVLSLATVVLAPSGRAGAWLLPVTAALCFMATLFAGRRYILPVAATSAATVLLSLTLLVTSAMLATWLLMRVGQWMFGGVGGATPLLVTFFLLVWFGVNRLARW